MIAMVSPFGKEIMICQCDVCWHIWLPVTPRVPQRCANRKCHTWVWNRERKSHTGRPDHKTEARKRESKLRPIIDVKTGCHHDLCPCLECLAKIVTVKPKDGRGKTNAGITKLCSATRYHRRVSRRVGVCKDGSDKEQGGAQAGEGVGRGEKPEKPALCPTTPLTLSV
jgi:hypothetical protein